MSKPLAHWLNWGRPPRHRREELSGELRAWLSAQATEGAIGTLPERDAELSWVTDAVQPLLALWREQRLELQAATHTLHAVLQSVDSAILAVSGDHRRLYANLAAERLFSLPPLDPTPARLATLQRIPLLVQWLDSVAGSGDAIAERLPLADERTLQVYVTPLDSRPPGCVIVARDITGTVRLETARRDFIAAISHELRTPLTSIQGYTEILKENPDLPRETRDQFLGVMLENTMRLARMARDLVTLSSLETGTYPFHFTSVEAASLVRPALAVVEPLATESGCRLVVEALEPGRIRGDPEALHRVLLNLLENAIVHGSRRPGGGGHGIDVYISGQVRYGEYGFAVRDTGAGIGSSDRPRVFERFYRVGRGENGPHHGTGLGLALVKHIVREHGGRVELSSVLGEGSTFWVWLPLAPQAPTDGALTAAADGSGEARAR